MRHFCDLNLQFPLSVHIFNSAYSICWHPFYPSDNSPLFFAELISTLISIGSNRWRQRAAITNIPASVCQLSLNWPRALSPGQSRSARGRWQVYLERWKWDEWSRLRGVRGLGWRGGHGGHKSCERLGSSRGRRGHYCSPVPVMSPTDLRTTQRLISPRPSSKSCLKFMDTIQSRRGWLSGQQVGSWGLIFCAAPLLSLRRFNTWNTALDAGPYIRNFHFD